MHMSNTSMFFVNICRCMMEEQDRLEWLYRGSKISEIQMREGGRCYNKEKWIIRLLMIKEQNISGESDIYNFIRTIYVVSLIDKSIATQSYIFLQYDIWTWLYKEIKLTTVYVQ